MGHLSDLDILDYLKHADDSEHSLAVEAHCAECPECLSRVRCLRMIREHFDLYWDSWTASLPGQGLSEALIAHLCGEPPGDETSKVIGVKELLGMMNKGLILAGKILLYAARNTALISGPPDLRPAYQGDGAHEDAALDEGRILLAAGQAEEALEVCSSASESGAGAAPMAISEMRFSDGAKLRAEVDCRQKKIIFRYWPGSSGSWPDVAILDPGKGEEGHKSAVFAREEDAGCSVAVFTGVPDGLFEFRVMLRTDEELKDDEEGILHHESP